MAWADLRGEIAAELGELDGYASYEAALERRGAERAEWAREYARFRAAIRTPAERKARAEAERRRRAAYRALHPLKRKTPAELRASKARRDQRYRVRVKARRLADPALLERFRKRKAAAWLRCSQRARRLALRAVAKAA